MSFTGLKAGVSRIASLLQDCEKNLPPCLSQPLETPHIPWLVSFRHSDLCLDHQVYFSDLDPPASLFHF